MTQQQKREKAAELLGWKRGYGSTTIWVLPNDAGSCYDVPHYDKDLNLMHEAEKVLTDDQAFLYRGKVWQIVAGDEKWPFSAVAGLRTHRMVWEATAAQRLDAWLEVMMEETQL